jgi:hypothetical protein
MIPYPAILPIQQIIDTSEAGRVIKIAHNPRFDPQGRYQSPRPADECDANRANTISRDGVGASQSQANDPRQFPVRRGRAAARDQD